MLTHSHLLTLFQALNEAEAKYVVVGGLAVNFHGYQRFTKDVDLLISLDDCDAQKMVSVLEEKGFKPIYPIDLHEFCDAEKREKWARERNMTVFSVVSDGLKGLTLDLFVKNPYEYSEIESDLIYENMEGVMIPTIDLGRLIEMKKQVARPQDLIDVTALERIQAEHLSRESEEVEEA